MLCCCKTTSHNIWLLIHEHHIDNIPLAYSRSKLLKPVINTSISCWICVSREVNKNKNLSKPMPIVLEPTLMFYQEL